MNFLNLNSKQALWVYEFVQTIGFWVLGMVCSAYAFWEGDWVLGIIFIVFIILHGLQNLHVWILEDTLKSCDAYNTAVQDTKDMIAKFERENP